MADRQKKLNTAAGETWAAVSFRSFPALIFGVGWGCFLTAFFAALLYLPVKFTFSSLVWTALGIVLLLPVHLAARRFSPWLGLNLFFITLCGAALTLEFAICNSILSLAAFALFTALFGRAQFAVYRRRFAIGALLGGAAAIQWTLPLFLPTMGLLLTTVWMIARSSYSRRRSTVCCWLLLCLCCLFVKFPFVSHKVQPKNDADEIQGITLIAAAATPECRHEPQALCMAQEDWVQRTWQSWGVFNRFSMLDSGWLMPWGTKFDLIFCDRINGGSYYRPGAVLARLTPGGVVVVPVEVAVNWPKLNWQIMPGSNRQFVAARPDDPGWQIVPARLEASLFREKGRRTESSISRGALTGMLTGFRSERVELPAPCGSKRRISHWSAWGVVLMFLILHWSAFRRPKFSERMSVAENCLGFSLLLLLLLKALPGCLEIWPVLLLFFLLYPIRMRNWLLKLTGTLAIAAALIWSIVPGTVAAAAALLLSGAEFSASVSGQLSEKPKNGAVAALIGIAAGVLLAAFAQSLPFAPMRIFQAALLFRIWTLIRS